MNTEFRKATSSDITVIHHLGEKIWRRHYPGIISNEQIEYMLHWMYSEESLQKQMDDGHAFTLLIVDEITKGYCSVSRSSSNDYFLHKLYIDPDLHGSGTGVLLLNH